MSFFTKKNAPPPIAEKKLPQHCPQPGTNGRNRGGEERKTADFWVFAVKNLHFENQRNMQEKICREKSPRFRRKEKEKMKRVLRNVLSKKNITNSSHKKATNRCNIQFVLHKSRKPRHRVPQCGITATMRYLHRRIQERAGERGGVNKKKRRREPAGEGRAFGQAEFCRAALPGRQGSPGSALLYVPQNKPYLWHCRAKTGSRSRCAEKRIR